MKILFKALLRTGLTAACVAGATHTALAAPLVNLAGVQYVTYGDAQVYSLPFAIIDKCGGTAAGCQYSISSTPGAIQDLVVVATGTSSNNAVTNFAGMDNAYSTPLGGGPSFFRPDPSPSINNGFQGTINNNGANTWDSSLAALKTFLAGNQLVTFFNNNQTNSGGESTQSLAGWAQVSITNASGGLIGVYDLTNQNSAYKLFTEGGGGTFMGPTTYTSAGLGNPIAGTNAATDYVLSGGAVCRQAGVPVSCSAPHNEGPVAHNLGADHAAVAILFPELNAQLSTLFNTLSSADLGAYTFHVDARLGCDPTITNIAGVCEGNGT